MECPTEEPSEDMVDNDLRNPKTESEQRMARRGKWTDEEEQYTSKIIKYFNRGLLRVPEGTTLRSYLAEKLQCDPMRITKKYTGPHCLGKRVFHPCEQKPASIVEMDTAEKELEDFRTRFIDRLKNHHKSRGRERTSARLVAKTEQRPVQPLATAPQQWSSTSPKEHKPEPQRHQEPPVSPLTSRAEAEATTLISSVSPRVPYTPYPLASYPYTYAPPVVYPYPMPSPPGPAYYMPTAPGWGEYMAPPGTYLSAPAPMAYYHQGAPMVPVSGPPQPPTMVVSGRPPPSRQYPMPQEEYYPAYGHGPVTPPATTSTTSSAPATTAAAAPLAPLVPGPSGPHHQSRHRHRLKEEYRASTIESRASDRTMQRHKRSRSKSSSSDDHSDDNQDILNRSSSDDKLDEHEATKTKSTSAVAAAAAAAAERSSKVARQERLMSASVVC